MWAPHLKNVVKKSYLPKAIELGQREVSACKNTFSHGTEAVQCAAKEVVIQLVPIMNAS